MDRIALVLTFGFMLCCIGVGIAFVIIALFKKEDSLSDSFDRHSKKDDL